MDNLPDELIVHITDRMDERALAAFSGTSQRFNNIGLDELQRRYPSYTDKHVEFMVKRPELHAFMSDRTNHMDPDRFSLSFEAYPAGSLDRIYLLCNITHLHDPTYRIEGSEFRNVMKSVIRKAQNFSPKTYSDLFLDDDDDQKKIVEYFSLSYSTSHSIYVRRFTFARLFLDGQYVPTFIAGFKRGLFEHVVFSLIEGNGKIRDLINAVINHGDEFLGKNPICNYYEVRLTDEFIGVYWSRLKEDANRKREDWPLVTYWNQICYRINEHGFQIIKRQKPIHNFTSSSFSNQLHLWIDPMPNLKIKLAKID